MEDTADLDDGREDVIEAPSFESEGHPLTEPSVNADDVSPVAAPLTREQLRKEREALLVTVRERMVELRSERDTAAQALLDMQDEEAKLLRSLEPAEGSSPDRTNILQIRAYLESQKELRMKRAAARVEALVRLGGDVSALRGKAPIDAAHARNTQRGTQRPQIAPRA